MAYIFLIDTTSTQVTKTNDFNIFLFNITFLLYGFNVSINQLDSSKKNKIF